MTEGQNNDHDHGQYQEEQNQNLQPAEGGNTGPSYYNENIQLYRILINDVQQLRDLENETSCDKDQEKHHEKDAYEPR